MRYCDTRKCLFNLNSNRILYICGGANQFCFETICETKKKTKTPRQHDAKKSHIGQ